MSKPGLIITGATGFLGSRLVKQLINNFQIFAISLHPPRDIALKGQNIKCFQVHVGDIEPLGEVFNHIREKGGADLLLHLAAHYDFTGHDHPEYMKTNIMGTRNLLELSTLLKLKKFIFTSSVAACPFPEPGKTITEETPSTAPITYARSKHMGENMMREYQDRIPSCILRLTAIFSDWCEYEPLNEFFQTWCSNRWNARIQGGKGESAIPYLHIRDLVQFYLRVIEKIDRLKPLEVLQASPNGSTTHLELYREATRFFFGDSRSSIHVPKPLARSGIILRERLGRLLGNIPFERSWMADYIDLRLDIDASKTHRLLDWTPSENLQILKRIPNMIYNMKHYPEKWEQQRRQNRKFRSNRRARF